MSISKNKTTIKFSFSGRRPSVKQLQGIKNQIALQLKMKGASRGMRISFAKGINAMIKDVQGGIKGKDFHAKYSQNPQRLMRMGFSAMNITNSNAPYVSFNMINESTNIGRKLMQEAMQGGKSSGQDEWLGGTLTSDDISDMDRIIYNMGGWLVANYKYRQDVERILDSKGIDKNWYSSRYFTLQKDYIEEEREDLIQNIRYYEKKSRKQAIADLPMHTKNLWRKF